MIHRIAGVAAVNLLAPLIALAGAPVIGRLYSPTAFGEYFFVFSVASILGLACTGMIHHGLFEIRDAETIRSLYTACCGFCVLTSGIIGVVAVLCFRTLSGDDVTGVVIGVWCAAIGVASVQATYLAVNGKLRFIAATTVARPCVLLALQVFLALLDVDQVHALLASALTAEVAVAGTAHLYITRGTTTSSKTHPWRSARPFLQNSYLLLPSQVLTLTVNSAPLLLLQSVLGSSAVGAYSMTLRLINTPASALTNAVKSMYWVSIRDRADPTGSAVRLFTAALSGGLTVSVAYGALDLRLGTALLGGNWAMVDAFIPGAVAWMASSLALSFPTEILKNTGLKRKLLLGELTGAVVKVAALVYIARTASSPYAFNGWFAIATIANTTLGATYILIRRGTRYVRDE